MKNLTLNNVRIAWNESKNSEFLKTKMVVYKLVFPDNTCYVGLTSLTMYEMLSNLCKYYHQGMSRINQKIKDYRSFLAEVLYEAEDKNDAEDYKKYAISKIVKEIAQKGHLRKYHSLQDDNILKVLLNDRW